ncbi:class I SAM-dependent methyltransferase [Gynuella sp.]|uniref:class I SAM-dependent methyltransferase n=1 Tax=Gynuella sp. TaxID=2969146 RepID=UPI003D0E658D
MWNQRFAADHYIYGTEPNDFLRHHFQAIPKGHVLCLAEGEGRNAVFLAQQGYQVTAVDSSDVGLEKARNLAAERNVSITTIHADLADFDLGTARWDGIVSIFGHLPSQLRGKVYQQAVNALKPKGVLLLEGYAVAQLNNQTGGPKDEDMLLSITALQQELHGLHFSHLEELEREVLEGTLHTGKAAVIQVIAHRPAAN